MSIQHAMFLKTITARTPSFLPDIIKPVSELTLTWGTWQSNTVALLEVHLCQHLYKYLLIAYAEHIIHFKWRQKPSPWEVARKPTRLLKWGKLADWVIVGLVSIVTNFEACVFDLLMRSSRPLLFFSISHRLVGTDIRSTSSFLLLFSSPPHWQRSWSSRYSSWTQPVEQQGQLFGSFPLLQFITCDILCITITCSRFCTTVANAYWLTRLLLGKKKSFHCS